jgi:hypothetical protein
MLTETVVLPNFDSAGAQFPELVAISAYRALPPIHLWPKVIGNELAEFLVRDGAVEELAIAVSERDQGIEKRGVESMPVVLECVGSRLRCQGLVGHHRVLDLLNRDQGFRPKVSPEDLVYPLDQLR